MAKFIDCSKAYSRSDDEILVRCSCGAEMVSFAFTKMKVEDKEMETLLVTTATPFVEKIKAKDTVSFRMMFPSEGAIELFYNIIKRKLNGGNGCVESLLGSLLGIQTTMNDDGNPDGICLMGFNSVKDFTKYNKAKEGKEDKYLAWEVYLDEKSYGALITQLDKIVAKRYPDFREEKQPEDGEE